MRILELPESRVLLRQPLQSSSTHPINKEPQDKF
jgi:hypothetical protein